ncbi:MAG: helix-turn-helix domain-containing protein [Nitrososphaera sp.]
MQRAASKRENQANDDRGWEGQPCQPEIFMPGVRFEECPIKASLGVLGKKWTMLILRDIGIRKIDRFNRLLESIPGLTPRILSRRLKELEAKGFIDCVENKDSPMIVRWTLTNKGRDTLPILLQLVVFGSKWHADEVFKDRRPRTLNELFNPDATKFIQPSAEV